MDGNEVVQALRRMERNRTPVPARCFKLIMISRADGYKKRQRILLPRSADAYLPNPATRVPLAEWPPGLIDSPPGRNSRRAREGGPGAAPLRQGEGR